MTGGNGAAPSSGETGARTRSRWWRRETAPSRLLAPRAPDDASKGVIEVVVHPRHWLAPLLRARGVTLGRHVFLAAASADDELLEHEIEHVRQYERHGVPGFLARYLAAYLRGRIAGLGHRDAYRAIPFEEQARVAAARRRGPPSLPSRADESRGPSPGRGA